MTKFVKQKQEILKLIRHLLETRHVTRPLNNRELAEILKNEHGIVMTQENIRSAFRPYL